MGLPSCMRQLSVDKKFFESTRMVKCPMCGSEFSLVYARAIACIGCPDSVRGCELVRCPNCDREFELKIAGIASTKEGSRSLAERMSRVLSEYCEDFGEKPSR